MQSANDKLAEWQNKEPSMACCLLIASIQEGKLCFAWQDAQHFRHIPDHGVAIWGITYSWEQEAWQGACPFPGDVADLIHAVLMQYAKPVRLSTARKWVQDLPDKPWQEIVQNYLTFWNKRVLTNNA